MASLFASIAATLLSLSLLAPAAGGPSLTPLTPEESAVKARLEQLVRQEEQAFLAGDAVRFAAVFGPRGQDADAARRMGERLGLFRAWAAARGVRLRLDGLTLRTPHIAFLPDHRLSVTAIVSEAYSYRYLGEPQEQSFGLGVRHYYTLQDAGGRLTILSDDFTAPARDRGAPPRPAPGRPQRSTPPRALAGGLRAAAYADLYCGAAPGCGNGGFPNPRYANLSGDGGDCTNFISQVLRAGGMREDASWFYDGATGEGSRAWSNAQGLADHLAWAPWAHRFASGDYAAIVAPTPDLPQGADRALRRGDLVSYVQHGDVVHTGVVAAYDPHGVPLVDAHYNDRHHTPWDFGWGQDARYRLWRIDYPQSPQGTASGGAPRGRRTAATVWSDQVQRAAAPARRRPLLPWVFSGP